MDEKNKKKLLKISNMILYLILGLIIFYMDVLIEFDFFIFNRLYIIRSILNYFSFAIIILLSIFLFYKQTKFNVENKLSKLNIKRSIIIGLLSSVGYIFAFFYTKALSYYFHYIFKLLQKFY